MGNIRTGWFNPSANGWYGPLVVLLCVWFGSGYLFAVKDGDLFWHLKTGEFLLHNWAFPDIDSFTFAGGFRLPPPEAGRPELILHGYWFGQILLALVHAVGGIESVVWLRALVYSAVLLLIAFWLGKKSKSFLSIFLLICIGFQLKYVPNERPQIFGFFCFATVLYNLDVLFPKVEDCRYNLAAIALAMLFWANIHGSYLVGIGVILLYLGERLCRRQISGDRRHDRIIYALLGSLLLTFAQPNNPLAVAESFLIGYGNFSSFVTEYRPPFASGLLEESVVPYLLLIVASIGMTIAGATRSRAINYVVFAILLGLSLTGRRYVPFALIGVPLVACSFEVRPLWNVSLSILCVAIAFVYGQRFVDPSFPGGVNRYLFPVGAVEFLNRERPQGNVFNFVDWGGYLMLYGEKDKVFTDGRHLDLKLVDEHNRAMYAIEYREIFDKYKIGIVVIPGTLNDFSDRNYATPYPLALNLAQDRNWSLVYFDETALVFARKAGKNEKIVQKYSLPFSSLLEHIRLRRAWQLAG